MCFCVRKKEDSHVWPLTIQRVFRLPAETKHFYGHLFGNFQSVSGAQRNFPQIHWLREALKVTGA